MLELKKEINQEEGILKFAIGSLGNTIKGAAGDGELIGIKYRKLKNTNTADFSLLKERQLARVDAEVIPFKSSYIKANDFNAALEIIPNPNNGTSRYLFSDCEEGNYAIALYAISGEKQTMISEHAMDIGDYKINISDLDIPPGLYLLGLENKEAYSCRQKKYLLINRPNSEFLKSYFC